MFKFCSSLPFLTRQQGCQKNFWAFSPFWYTYTYTHTNIYICIYIALCWAWQRAGTDCFYVFNTVTNKCIWEKKILLVFIWQNRELRPGQGKRSTPALSINKYLYFTPAEEKCSPDFRNQPQKSMCGNTTAVYANRPVAQHKRLICMNNRAICMYMI